MPSGLLHSRHGSVDESVAQSEPSQHQHVATAQTFAHTVLKHAQKTHRDSLYPGQNYQRLAEFLSRPYESLAAGNRSFAATGNENVFVTGPQDDEDGAFLTTYYYSPSGVPTVGRFAAHRDGWEAFEQRHEVVGSGCAQLLFMRGLAPPEWLNTIGSTYRVDPEYIRQHLRFLQPYEQFDIPGLPTIFTNCVRLPLMTNGIRDGGEHQEQLGGADMVQDRKDTSMRINMHLQNLDKNDRGGQSIVRKLMLHNKRYFSLEQEVSICVVRKRGGWVAVIWLDCGTEKLDSQLCQWLKVSELSHLARYNLLPVFQFREKMAMKREDRIGTARRPSQPSSVYSAGVASAQSAMLLPDMYGQTLDQAIIRVDAFYALSEIFAFSAFSENQFLNLLASTIEQERNLPIRKMQASLANLQVFKDVLEAHIEKQKALVTLIESRARLKWPQATDPTQSATVDAVADDLLENFKHLKTRAENLRAQCVDMSNLTINQAMLEEAQRGLRQGAALSRLTLLAFFFVPLSFTTSFFGMNFMELVSDNGPRLGIYVWFAVSVPIFAGSLAVLFWEQLLGVYQKWLECFV
ncbi:hypothetical protein M409DRAFT_63836 [Zasmidium cellare ATCC 36951]|uniref:Uncharacterized protein n=1 Tax=Zasmidium cellare ATCC 36951 TaxID=1080233 RepID=A0A6A6CU28_ZASCE|nr:uncharacterized protein M409DRAFT_63836 [Zasmidium cellare ATCC 36951]KAF2170767.1 hypothetical protein M409DRAFT_63836 [Zasmidium cellare ATCC 36951]